MAGAKLSFTGVEDVVKNMRHMQLNTIKAAIYTSQMLADTIQDHSKVNRPWTDRTGDARRSIYGFSDVEGKNIVIYHGIGVDYGKYLELSNGGKYRVIRPTINHFRPIYSREMSKILRK